MRRFSRKKKGSLKTHLEKFELNFLAARFKTTFYRISNNTILNSKIYFNELSTKRFPIAKKQLFLLY